MRYPSKEAREIIQLARQIGWRHEGYSGQNHPVLVHENGARVTICATPSDRRNRANSIALLERLAGQKFDNRRNKKRAS